MNYLGKNMNNIIYDEEIITPNNNKYYYYYNFTKKLDKKDCVKFALFCAKSVNPNTKETNQCIALTEKWLVDEKSVSKEELNNASSADSAAYAAYAAAASTVFWTTTMNNHNTIDINLYLKILLRTIKQYNTIKHNNQYYEFILKQIINEDIDKITDADYNMLIDLSQEYYNINPNITNKRIFIELLRKEYI